MSRDSDVAQTIEAIRQMPIGMVSDLLCLVGEEVESRSQKEWGFDGKQRRKIKAAARAIGRVSDLLNFYNGSDK